MHTVCNGCEQAIKRAGCSRCITIDSKPGWLASTGRELKAPTHSTSIDAGAGRSLMAILTLVNRSVALAPNQRVHAAHIENRSSGVVTNEKPIIQCARFP